MWVLQTIRKPNVKKRFPSPGLWKDWWRTKYNKKKNHNAKTKRCYVLFWLQQKDQIMTLWGKTAGAAVSICAAHFGFHANEDRVVFSSTSADGGIRSKGKWTFAGALKSALIEGKKSWRVQVQSFLLLYLITINICVRWCLDAGVGPLKPWPYRFINHAHSSSFNILHVSGSIEMCKIPSQNCQCCSMSGGLTSTLQKCLNQLHRRHIIYGHLTH